MLIYCVKLDHALYSINYGIAYKLLLKKWGGGGGGGGVGPGGGYTLEIESTSQ